MKKIAYGFGSLIVVVFLLIASSVRPDIPVQELKPKYANEHSKFVSIDGLSVHYRDEGAGFPVVLLHGSPSSLHTWDALTKDLSKHYRVIRLDLPGDGLTGPNQAHDYSTRWYLSFLDAFLKAVRVDDCYLIGNSFGGRLAAEFAYEKKARIKKLVLIASAGYPQNEDAIPAVKMARSPLLRPFVRYATPRFFIAMNVREAYGTKNVPDETIDRYYDLLRREGNRETFIAMCNKNPEDITSHIKAIRIPTLILWGNRDTAIPVEHAERFHRDIPKSEMVIYPGVGHVPHEMVPEKTGADILAFLR